MGLRQVCVSLAEASHFLDYATGTDDGNRQKNFHSCLPELTKRPPRGRNWQMSRILVVEDEELIRYGRSGNGS